MEERLPGHIRLIQGQRIKTGKYVWVVDGVWYRGFERSSYDLINKSTYEQKNVEAAKMHDLIAIGKVIVL